MSITVNSQLPDDYEEILALDAVLSIIGKLVLTSQYVSLLKQLVIALPEQEVIVLSDSLKRYFDILGSGGQMVGSGTSSFVVGMVVSAANLSQKRLKGDKSLCAMLEKVECLLRAMHNSWGVIDSEVLTVLNSELRSILPSH